MSRGRHVRPLVQGRHVRTGRRSSLTGWSAHASVLAMTPVIPARAACPCHPDQPTAWSAA